MAPRVSVILNCYNHAPYVAEAVDSVLAQTFADLELILIDNGSTDGTRAVLERYDDPRIRRFFHDSNESLSKRLNEGVAASRGEYVAVLYSDDWMLPDKLARQVAMFDRLPADYGVVYCPARGFNQHSKETWTHPLHGLSGNVMPGWFTEHWKGHIDMSSPLTRREAFVRYPFYEDLRFEGEAVFMRIALTYKFHFDPEPTVVLRDIGSNIGKAIQPNHEMAMELLARFKAMPEVPDALRRVVSRFMAVVVRQHMWVLLRVDPSRGGYARKKLLGALKDYPAQVVHPRMLGGLLIASLPRPLRQGINTILNKARHHSGERKVREAW